MLFVDIVEKKNLFCRGVVTSPCNGFRHVKNSLVEPCIVSGVDSGWLDQRCDCRYKPVMCAEVVCCLHKPVKNAEIVCCLRKPVNVRRCFLLST